MPAPKPDTIKQVKDISRPVITFGLARKRGTGEVFLGCSDFKVYSADLAAEKFEPKELYGHDSYVTAVALVGTQLVSCSYDGRLKWYDTESGELVRTVEAHSKWIRKVITSPDGRFVASVADDMACKVWDVATGKLVHDLRGHREKTPNDFPSMLYAVTFSHDGKRLATGDKVGHVVIWDVKTGKELSTLESVGMYTWDKVQRLHSIGGIRSLAFSPDGKQLAVGGMGKVGNIDHLEGKARLELFEVGGGKSLWVAESDKYRGLVNKLEWAADGSWVLGAGGAGEGHFLFYDPAAKKTLHEEKAKMHVHDFDLTPDAKELVAVGHNRITIHKLG
jgi:WD40 repeat protein